MTKKLLCYAVAAALLPSCSSGGKQEEQEEEKTTMAAGIDYIRGDALVIIDADLQHPPELIPEMLLEIEMGYDDVYAVMLNRKGETWFKRFSSHLYYRLLEKLSNTSIQKDTGDFRMLNKRAIAALRELKENERNMKGLFSFIGFKKKALYYERDSRIAGKTKWNYLQLFKKREHACNNIKWICPILRNLK